MYYLRNLLKTVIGQGIIIIAFALVFAFLVFLWHVVAPAGFHFLDKAMVNKLWVLFSPLVYVFNMVMSFLHSLVDAIKP